MRYKICHTFFKQFSYKRASKRDKKRKNISTRMQSSIIISFLLISIAHSEKNDKFPDLINSEPWLYWQRLGVFHHKLPKRAQKESIVIKQRIKQQRLRMKIAKMLGQVKNLNDKTKENTAIKARKKSARLNKFNQFHNKT